MNYDDALLLAYKTARFSDDPSTQNGAVLIDDEGRNLAVGFNTFPLGIDPKHWHGEKEAKYARVVHAETGVLLVAAKKGVSTLNSTMVCPWAACANCAKHIAYSGVKRLVRHSYANNGVDTGSHWYHDCLIGDEIMREAGVEIIEVDPIEVDFQLRRNGQLWPA